MGIVWRLFGNDARSGVCHNPFIAFLLSEALEEKLQKLQKRKNGENDGQIDEALRKLNKLLCLCYKVVCAQDKILCGDISIFGKTNIKRSPSITLLSKYLPALTTSGKVAAYEMDCSGLAPACSAISLLSSPANQGIGA